MTSQLSLEQILAGAGVLLLLSVIASLASGRLGIPAVLLFLVIGMLAGSEGVGGIYFDDARLAQWVGVVALCFILFSGGLDTDMEQIEPVLTQGLALSTGGVALTTVLVGLFVMVTLHFSFVQGLLLGAIVSATDAAAVFTVLRSQQSGLKGHLAALLELESGSNDPMAVFLTIGLTDLLIHPELNGLALIPRFATQMAVGAALGYGTGKAGPFVLNRLRLHSDGLCAVFTVALVLLTYGVTGLLGGSGFLAVYVAGVILGNSQFARKRRLTGFHDGLAWLMQITMFLALGLLVFPSRLIPVAGIGLVTAVFLALVARPASVFAVLAPMKVGVREMTLVSCGGLRGAAPIVLATFPLLAGAPQADLLFNLVFFVVLTSVLVQGTTVLPVARWLGLDVPAAEGGQGHRL